MGRKQKIKQARHEQATGSKPRREVKPGSRVRHAWIFGVLGVLAALVATLVVLFIHNQSKLFQVALLEQSYQVDEQLRANLGKFTTEDGGRLETMLHDVQAINNLGGLDNRALGQLKFVLGVIGEIAQAGDLEPGELTKLETQLQGARDYVNRQTHPRRP
jgi:hypothetical protein